MTEGARVLNLGGDVVEAPWSPQRGSQRDFLTCPIFEVLYEGTRGPGKTDCLLMDFLQDVGAGWGAEWRGILFRRTYPELKDVIAKSLRWFPILAPGCTYNKSDHTWTFRDGEQLIFAHANKAADYWNYHGHAYPWIGWEELTNWADDYLYRKLMSCSRSTNPKMPRKYRATCNPYGVGHNWVKKRFGLPHSRGVVQWRPLDHEGHPEPPRVAIHGALKENRILLDADPEYVSKLRASARNPAELRAWLYGDWDIVAGGMFDDVWDPRVHVVDPFVVPRSWRVDRSFDWGSSKPFSVGWWAQSDGTQLQFPDGRVMHTVRGDLFRIHEWYGCHRGQANTGLNMDAGAVARGIVERENDLVERGVVQGRILPGPADAAIASSDNGPTVEEDMMAEGVEWELAAKGPGSRAQGWLQVRRLLRAALNQTDEGEPRPGPREDASMFFTRTCTSAIELLPVLPRDDKNMDDVDTNAEDHVGDEVRYRARHDGVGVRSRNF